MQVFIMRHGEAALDAISDSARQLTPRGCNESQEMAHWLAQKEPKIDLVLVSPYIRAEQTLQVVRKSLSLPVGEEVLPGLSPSGDAAMVSSYLQVIAEQGHNAVLVVSHLPLVGYLVAELCPAETPPMFATSAITCVDLNSQTGKGTLVWQVSPSQLAARA
ncbi:phosphohistidine phosphatase SixA [Photorhabdus heterorhabditis]|uniref:Phosphohistidine phosphatase n=1 Tax=Photorhabdus heterorhabditis TaxID=880156 RepID=A0ABR5K8T8_9GAMM|nr:phosphohistidine phosphatase SixA [Photorhabdus heterorhabditis]KOY60906.1 phosphohistidine phosphatase [Photorhabdus heterorhabditis]MBS9441930.1 phosphohistidine phosphatase SixA [Photorhabdus heterorhabditis]NRN28753.1 phosphohistidine phosphatase SixA [Photorhabdus heterorhabditis subsp. aluminescens]